MVLLRQVLDEVLLRDDQWDSDPDLRESLFSEAELLLRSDTAHYTLPAPGVPPAAVSCAQPQRSRTCSLPHALLLLAPNRTEPNRCECRISAAGERLHGGSPLNLEEDVSELLPRLKVFHDELVDRKMVDDVLGKPAPAGWVYPYRCTHRTSIRTCRIHYM